jgi:hypothetical protein
MPFPVMFQSDNVRIFLQKYYQIYPKYLPFILQHGTQI